MVNKKLKKPRNLTVAQWEKMQEMAGRLASVDVSCASMKQDYERQIAKHREMNASFERAANDKNATISRQSEDLNRAQSHIKSVEAERDRIVRLVDQFTSIQIIGHGQTLNPTSGQIMADQPKSLRRT